MLSGRLSIRSPPHANGGPPPRRRHGAVLGSCSLRSTIATSPAHHRVPDDLAASITRFYGEAGTEFTRRVPRLVDRLERRWSLRIGRPLPGARTAFVAPCTLADGADAVLRIAYPEAPMAVTAAALHAWGGRGSVRLLAADFELNALLVERCRPGTPLGEREGTDEVLSVAAELLERLWGRQVASEGFPHLAELAATRAEEGAARLGSRPPNLDARLAREGLELWRELSETASPVLLHADLHPRNVLAAAREPWLVIDPKPLVGDPAYDLIPLVLEAPGRPAAARDPDAHRRETTRRVAEVSGHLGLDAGRVAAWGVARSVDWALFLGDRGEDELAWGAAADARAFATIS